MSKPFIKNIYNLPMLEAHGGIGQRQQILSKDDDISGNILGMTKAYLPPGSVFDWHMHGGIDELFVVIKGSGVVRFEDKTKFDYQEGDIVYIPGGIEHQIQSTGEEESQFYFLRVNK